MGNTHTWLLIAVIALVTAFLRFLPFLVFNEKRKTPKLIDKLGKSLPYAIMGMLVVYCLKDITFSSIGGYLPYVIATVVVLLLHIWRRNTLISIVSGTVVYMLLVQFVFK